MLHCCISLYTEFQKLYDMLGIQVVLGKNIITLSHRLALKLSHSYTIRINVDPSYTGLLIIKLKIVLNPNYF